MPGLGLPGYVQRATFETEIIAQHKACREAFNSGDLDLIMYAVDFFHDMLTSDIVDEQFRKEVRELDLWWVKQKKRIKEVYLERKRKAINPDVVSHKKMVPPKVYWRLKLQYINNCCQRRGIYLTPKDEQHY